MQAVRGLISDASSYNKGRLRTEFIHGTVMLSEAKHLWFISVRDRVQN
jgi:hypothetical protein